MRNSSVLQKYCLPKEAKGQSPVSFPDHPSSAEALAALEPGFLEQLVPKMLQAVRALW